jgi:hypothetical protein
MIGLSVDNLTAVAGDILTLTDNVLSAAAGYTTRPTTLVNPTTIPHYQTPVGNIDRFLVGAAPSLTSKYT